MDSLSFPMQRKDIDHLCEFRAAVQGRASLRLPFYHLFPLLQKYQIFVSIAMFRGWNFELSNESFPHSKKHLIPAESSL